MSKKNIEKLKELSKDEPIEKFIEDPSIPLENEVVDEYDPELDEYDPELDEDEEPEFITDNKGFTLDEIEKTIISLILNNKVIPETVNEHVFSNYTYKEVFIGSEHFSKQDKEGKFDPSAVGILLSKRRNNEKWKDTIVPELIAYTEGKDLKLENYLSILKEEHIAIKSLEIAEQIKNHVQKGDMSYLKQAANELGSIESFDDDGYDCLDDAVDTAMFDLQEKIDSDEMLSGIPTGLPSLDDVTGGLQKSDLIILAARPGQGKTATAINFAYNSGVSCGFISSEMPSSQLALRLLSLDSGVDAQKLRNPKKLNKNEQLLLKKSAKFLKEEKELYIKDKPSISIQEVKEVAKKWKDKFDIKVLFIDYLQRLTYVAPGSDRMPRSERVGMIALDSKEIARELDIAVVGLAQISRGAEKNDATGGQPMLSDLKDSGMLEQEADLVICPWRENTSGMDVNSVTEMIILILKNRHGPLGEIDVLWTPKNMKISEETNGFVTDEQLDEEEADEEDVSHF